jgi:tRNA dimethylallyltransferase
MTGPIFLLLGPTASGKTALALELAARLPLEILNCDSMQVYRGMDIGTAKPTAEELARAPHHLFDLVAPDQELNAGSYGKLADAAIAEVEGRGRFALLVGGTGLWARAVTHGVAPMPDVPPEVRETVRRDLKTLGAPALHQRLVELDPVAAARLHPNDSQRIARALEVALGTGRPISAYQEAHGFAQQRYPHLVFGIRREREELYQRIAERVPRMFEAGFLEEAQRLLDQGYAPDLRAFKALGYHEAFRVLRGRLEVPAAVELIIHAHRHYARRQLTWFRGEESLQWVTPDGAGLTQMLGQLEEAMARV